MVKTFVRNLRNRLMQVLPRRTAITLEFLLYHRRLPRLDHPRTFCEKVARRKLYDHDPRLPVMADKIRAKEEVIRILGEEWVIPTIWSGVRLPPRSERNWPLPYVIKASHGSGWNIFVLSKEDEDWDRIEAQTQRWLSGVYGQHAREWLYTQMKPGLIVEPFLGTGEVAPPDYKFFVFGGKTFYVQVDLGRMQNHRQLFYDVNWKRQGIEFRCPWSDEEAAPPQSLHRMIDAANKLGAGFPFVRVDLYEIDGRPLFGEITFYPNSGLFEFKPKSAELLLGQLWPD
jgi:hypothetical protein